MSIELMKKRLAYRGGDTEGRLQKDKLNAFKQALWNSYQAETAILADGREFKCLINPDKLKPEYDNKIISIPFEDYCLNSDDKERQVIGMKPGDSFIWKSRTGHADTKWLVYLQHIEEDSYFRAEIRKCDYEFEINGNKYPIYVRGPVETNIPWNQKKGIVWNNLNYTLVMYITKNEETNDYFERFTKIDFDDKKWEVQAVNRYDSSGAILEVFLKETFSNTIEEEAKQEQELDEVKVDTATPHIVGETEVFPYDILDYSIVGTSGGTWSISNNKAKIIKQNDLTVEIEVITSRSGDFNLIYNGEDLITLPIVIKSL